MNTTISIPAGRARSNSTPTNHPNKGFLRRIGVYGYDEVEPVVLASLLSGDPLLLVGRAGTGKTFLLNSLSEALGLDHRHYNASMIAFDDLVGFPLPDAAGNSVRYVPTPATIWGAGSVLVDEINRCRPEHQNRFFSLVHERRIQGIRIDTLKYRWAAMNPAGLDDAEQYTGTEALDPALADRFAFVITVKDWAEFTFEEQQRVADPRGEGAISNDKGQLSTFLADHAERFQGLLQEPPAHIIAYCVHAASELNLNGLRISPRRVRQWVRNALALLATGMASDEQALWTMLRWSIPQRASTTVPEEAVLQAAHRMAYSACGHDAKANWLLRFHQATLPTKAEMLLQAPTPDAGTQAVNDLLSHANGAQQAAFAIAVYPALLSLPTPVVGAEGLHDLGLIAKRHVHHDAQHRFSLPGATGSGDKPGVVPILAASFHAKLTPERRARLEHLLKGLILDKVQVAEAALPQLEAELESCWQVCARHLQQNAQGTQQAQRA